MNYRVIASNPETAVVALRDESGLLHLGRAVAPAPAPGAELHGDPPAVGLRALRVADVGGLCPVVLVLLGCDLEAAVQLIEMKRSL